MCGRGTTPCSSTQWGTESVIEHVFLCACEPACVCPSNGKLRLSALPHISPLLSFAPLEAAAAGPASGGCSLGLTGGRDAHTQPRG